ncbi:DHA2 family efflux MFS transporter permease subunit [Paenibacillus caui]|uniref:DHA2 family efflux MFS transporter permease subunit n=1 Tax=Paenibacillus caui TaxID=2873927 RepID=UPI003B587003
MDLSKIKRGPIIAALIIGAFVSILNETLLNIAFPYLMRDFGIGESTVQWLATAYMLVVGILVPITALLQQWFTTRQMFIGAMTLFLAGTLICGFSPVFGMLLGGRIIQALGTGLLLPVLMNTILVIFPPENRGAAMGMIGLVIMTAPAIGPTLSGLIIESFNWRWLFFLIVPLAVFSIVFAAGYLKNVTELTKPKVDILSILLSSVGFGGIVYGFSSAGEGDWSDPQVVWTIAAGALSLLLFVWRQLTMKDPMLDLRAFKYPMFSLVAVLMLVLMMSMFSTMIMLPLFLQKVLGLTALSAGLVLMPGGLVNGLMAPISGKLFDKFGPRMLVIPGLALMCLSIFLFSRIESSWTGGYVIFLHVMMMIGISMVMMPAQTTGLNQLPRQLYPHGTAIINTLQQVAGAIGTALFVSIMSSGAKNYVSNTGNLDLTEAMVAGLHNSFLTGVYLTIAALILGIFVKRTFSKEKEEADPKEVKVVAEQ